MPNKLLYKFALAVVLWFSTIPAIYAGDKIIAFGDSITRGYPYYINDAFGETNGSYTPALQALLNAGGWDAAVRNHGNPGENLNAGLAGASSGEIRMTSSILPMYKPDYVLIMEGTNDIPHGWGGALIRDALSRTVDKVKQSGKTPILGTLLPRFDGFGGGISTVNALIAQLAAEKNIKLADLYHATTWISPAYMNSDGLHPTLAGYSSMATPWYQALLASKPIFNTAPIYLLLLD